MLPLYIRLNFQDNQRMTFEACLGNKKIHRQWINWNVAMLKWNWNKLNHGIELMCFEDGSKIEMIEMNWFLSFVKFDI
jgi:hypothetical protein